MTPTSPQKEVYFCCLYESLTRKNRCFEFWIRTPDLVYSNVETFLISEIPDTLEICVYDSLKCIDKPIFYTKRDRPLKTTHSRSKIGGDVTLFLYLLECLDQVEC